MRIFLTGAGGYIGGSVADLLIREGYRIRGLVRSPERAAALQAHGIEPVIGSLTDLSLLTECAREADAVINTAHADETVAVAALIEGLVGSDKPFLHTSGTSVVADRACGEPGGFVFNEDSPLEPLPERLLRVAVERSVLLAARQGVRSVVIRPSLIYGHGRGLNPHSHQIPTLVRLAKEHGVARHVGRGLNIWSHVHIDDVASLYRLALAEAPPGSVFFIENGEASWKAMASAIGEALGLGPETKDWPVEEALAAWGAAAITSFGSNSRVSALKARRMLGWRPQGPGLFEWIETSGERLRGERG